MSLEGKDELLNYAQGEIETEEKNLFKIKKDLLDKVKNLKTDDINKNIELINVTIEYWCC